MKLDGQPLPDELIDKLEGDDLMVAYLEAKVTPEQEKRILDRMKQLFPKR